MAIVRYAVLNDVHFPYEGNCYFKALKEIKKWKDLAGIYFNGDILEVESLSRHPKGPSAISSFQHEVEYANGRFDDLEKMFKGVPVTLVEGNHCYRLFRYIRDVAPALWGLLNHPELLEFDRRGWKFEPYGPRQWVKCGKSKLWLRHEPLGGGQYPTKITAEKSDVDVLFGHTHIYQQYVCKKHGPKIRHVKAYSGGWLGDIKQPVFDYRGAKDNWCEGFSEIKCETRTGEYEYRFHYL